MPLAAGRGGMEGAGVELEQFRQRRLMRMRWLEIVLLSWFIFFLNCGDASCSISILPEPQEIHTLAQDFSLTDQAWIALPLQPSGPDLFLARFLQSELANRHNLAVPIRRVERVSSGQQAIVMGTLANPLIQDYCRRFKLPDITRPEGYVLEINATTIVIAGSDEHGAFYGLQSLRQLIERRKGSLWIPGMRVRDWPRCPFRAARLYLPGRDNIPFFKRLVRDFLALYKYNRLIVEVNAGMQLERHPELNAGWRELAQDLIYSRRERPAGPHQVFQDSANHDTADSGVIEKEEVAELVDWAHRHHLEVIPEIPSLTHSYYLLTRHRELAEIPEAEWPDAYCPSNPKTYELLFDVLDEYIEVMKPALINVGHDEWRAPVDVCPLCRGKDPRLLFADDLRKIHDYLAAKGVKTAVYGDHFLPGLRGERILKNTSQSGFVYFTPGGLASEQVRQFIPKDIVIFNWVWQDGEPGQGEPNDQQFSHWGFQQAYGNLTPAIRNFGRRSELPGVIGGAPASWAATTEFNFGKNLLYDFVGCANLLWSSHWPEEMELARLIQDRIPEIRRNLTGQELPSEKGDPVEALDISAFFNGGLDPVFGFNPRGLVSGHISAKSRQFNLADSNLHGGKSAVFVGTRGQGGNQLGLSARIAEINDDPSSLIFLHACARPATNANAYEYVYNFPDTADLLGWYEVAYDDGLITTVPIRYGVNILEWKWRGERGTYCYQADTVPMGNLDNMPITFFAYEWVNPRFGKQIKQIRLVGSSGFVNEGATIASNAIIVRAVSIVKKRAYGSEKNVGEARSRE
jgi:hypothetical protein